LHALPLVRLCVTGWRCGQGDASPPDIWDMGRMIATARVLMPKTMVRLSAGRLSFSEAEQVSTPPFKLNLQLILSTAALLLSAAAQRVHVDIRG
jgi:biotin synthase-like enzyme